MAGHPCPRRHRGFGARLLALQDADGQAGGAYFPKTIAHPVEWGDEEAQPWLATAWALKDLREWGVDAAVLGDTAERVGANARWEYDDLPYWGGEVDACINASTLATGQWLGPTWRACVRGSTSTSSPTAAGTATGWRAPR